MIKKINRISIFLFFLFLTFFSFDIKADEIDGYYIYSETCLECAKLETDITNFSKNKNIEFIIFNNENKEYVENILEKYNINSFKVPFLIYDEVVYSNSSAIKEFISNPNSENISVYILGFLDGFNPCAISILMIFSSFLITIEKRKQLIFIGMFFIMGSFLANFLLGFGLLKIAELISNFKLFSIIIYVLTFLVCLYVIIINFIDIYNGLMKKKNIKNMLSLKVRYKINQVMSKGIVSKTLFLSSFLIGFVIAILEFGCTGQLYLPAVMYFKEMSLDGIINLLIYNLMFIVPLLLFLFLALFINPEKIQKNIMEKSFIIKIVINIILIILICFVLKTLFVLI